MIYKWFNPNLKYADYSGKTEADEASMTWESFILGVPLPPPPLTNGKHQL